MKEKLKTSFETIFSNSENLQYYFSPGRINIIGEHIDYNGGLVFPCAISLGTYAAISVREDDIINLYSENFPQNGIISFKLSDELTKSNVYVWFCIVYVPLPVAKSNVNSTGIGPNWPVYLNPAGCCCSPCAGVSTLVIVNVAAFPFQEATTSAVPKLAANVWVERERNGQFAFYLNYQYEEFYHSPPTYILQLQDYLQWLYP